MGEERAGTRGTTWTASGREGRITWIYHPHSASCCSSSRRVLGPWGTARGGRARVGKYMVLMAGNFGTASLFFPPPSCSPSSSDLLLRSVPCTRDSAHTYDPLDTQAFCHLCPSHGKYPLFLIPFVRSPHCHQSYRQERDTFGDLQVPADRYWGAQTQRYVPSSIRPCSHSSNSQLTPELRHRRSRRTTPTPADQSLWCPQKGCLRRERQLWHGPQNR